jgi:protein-tyrosine phosphatase
VRAARERASIDVPSRGLLPGGHSAPPQVIAAAAPYGVDLSGHVSTQLEADDLSAADAVVTMSRQHLREAVLLVPDVWPRAFTLPQLVRRGEQVGPRVAGQTIGEWFAQVHEGRQRKEMIGTVREDDVADPYGGPDAGYRRMATALADLTDRLGHLLWKCGPTEA